MIEVTVLNHLKSALGVDVYMQRPENAPKQYVLVEKTGSARTNKINQSTFALQSYADTLYKAAALNESVKEAVESLADNDEIGRVSLNSDYNFTNVASKQYRYQAIFVITHY